MIEPFCGGLSMTCAMIKEIPLVQVIASDAAPGLITLYEAVRSGWVPPQELSREQWAALKTRAGEDDRLVAFAGFGCSFNGVYFASYGEPSFARQAAAGLERKIGVCSKVRFLARPYQEISVDDPCVIYCDPPYRNTDPSAYRSLKFTDHARFDSDAFWVWCREQAHRGAHVLVSEYAGPVWARTVWERPLSCLTGAHAGNVSTAVERLFYVGPSEVA